jgi:hypothetical protein
VRQASLPVKEGQPSWLAVQEESASASARTEDRRQKTKDKRQKTKDKRQKTKELWALFGKSKLFMNLLGKNDELAL